MENKKQRPISLIRLYKIASIYTQNLVPEIEPQWKTIADFLKYVSEHKNDEL
jgi:hypothetical protein